MDREKVISEIKDALSNDLVKAGYIYGLSLNGLKDKALTDVLVLLKEQEAKTGYWIDSAGNDKCSICGTEYSDLYPDYGNTHFCPNCGAKMEGR